MSVQKVENLDGFNELDIRKFYKFLNKKNPSQVKFIYPNNKQQAIVETINNEEDLITIIKKYNGKYNCFIHLHECGDIKNTCYTSEDIISVSRIAIDIDANKKEGHDGKTSSDKQLEELIKLGESIQTYSISKGFKKPSLVCSGNGVHVYFQFPKIDITDDNRTIIKNKIKAFEQEIRDKFQNEDYKVDSIHDLARVIKIPGTLSVKGTNHRLSYIIDGIEIDEDQDFKEYLLSLEVNDEKKQITKLSRILVINDEHNSVIINNIPKECSAIEEWFKTDWSKDFDRSKNLFHVACYLLYLFAKDNELDPFDIDIVNESFLNDEIAQEKMCDQLIAFDQSINGNKLSDKNYEEGYIYDNIFKNPHFAPIKPCKYLRTLSCRESKPFYYNLCQGCQERTIFKPIKCEYNPTIEEDIKIVNIEDRVNDVNKWFNQEVKQDLNTILVNNAEASLGKTEMMIDHCRNSINNILYLVPTKKLAHEVYQRMVEHADLKDQVSLFLGRCETNCSKYAKVQQIMRKNMSISKLVCSNCKDKKCCIYLKSIEEAPKSKILISTSANIFLQSEINDFFNDSRFNNQNRPEIIFDEDFFNYYSRQEFIDINKLKQYKDIIKSVSNDNSLKPAFINIINSIISFNDSEYDELNLDLTKYDGTIDLFSKDKEYLSKTFNSIQQAILTYYNNTTPQCIDYSYCLLDLLFNKTTLYKNKEKNRIYKYKRVKFPEDRLIHILDASANIPFYENLFKEKKLNFYKYDEKSFVKSTGKIYQVVDSVYGKSNLDEKIQTLNRFIKEYLDKYKRNTLVITYLLYSDKFKEIKSPGTFDYQVETFGNIRGIDKYKGYDVIVIGQLTHNNSQYAEEVRKYFGKEVISEYSKYENKPIYADENLDNSYFLPSRVFEDNYINMIYQQFTIGETYQAIARSRFLRQDVRCILFCNTPLFNLMTIPIRLTDLCLELGISELKLKKNQIEAKNRRIKAQELRDEDKTVKEIATTMNLNIRTIQRYLN